MFTFATLFGVAEDGVASKNGVAEGEISSFGVAEDGVASKNGVAEGEVFPFATLFGVAEDKISENGVAVVQFSHFLSILDNWLSNFCIFC